MVESDRRAQRDISITISSDFIFSFRGQVELLKMSARQRAPDDRGEGGGGLVFDQLSAITQRTNNPFKVYKYERQFNLG